MLNELSVRFCDVPNPRFHAWVDWFVRQCLELMEAKTNHLEHEVVWREDALADDLTKVIKLLAVVAKSDTKDMQLLIDLSRNGSLFGCWYEAILRGAGVLPDEYKNQVLDRLRDEAVMPIYQRLRPGTTNGCLKRVLFDRLEEARRSSELA